MSQRIKPHRFTSADVAKRMNCHVPKVSSTLLGLETVDRFPILGAVTGILLTLLMEGTSERCGTQLLSFSIKNCVFFNVTRNIRKEMFSRLSKRHQASPYSQSTSFLFFLIN